MAIFNMGGGGGSRIPFDVIVSKEKPTSIRKDTIWVNPDLTRVTSYNGDIQTQEIKGPLYGNSNKYYALFEEDEFLYSAGATTDLSGITFPNQNYVHFRINESITKFRWGFANASAESTPIIKSGIVTISSTYQQSSAMPELNLNLINQTVYRNGLTDDKNYYFHIPKSSALGTYFFIEALEFAPEVTKNNKIYYSQAKTLATNYTTSNIKTAMTGTKISVKANALKSQVNKATDKTTIAYTKYTELPNENRVYKIHLQTLDQSLAKFFILHSAPASGTGVSDGIEGTVFFDTFNGFRNPLKNDVSLNRFDKIFEWNKIEQYIIFNVEGYKKYFEDIPQDATKIYLGFNCGDDDTNPVIEDITSIHNVIGNLLDLDKSNYSYPQNNIENLVEGYNISNSIPDDINLKLQPSTFNLNTNIHLWIRLNQKDNVNFAAINTSHKKAHISIDAVICALRYRGINTDTPNKGDFQLYYLNSYFLHKNEDNTITEIKLSQRGGAIASIKNLVEGITTAIEDPTIEKVRPYGFYKYNNLQEVAFPSCHTIGAQAFNDCTALEEVYFPEWDYGTTDFAVAASPSPFSGCLNIHTATIGTTEFTDSETDRKPVYNPFEAAKNILRNVTMSSCSKVGKYTFYNYVNLQKTILPEDRDVYINTGAFQGCTNLSEITGNIKAIGSIAFSNNASLTTLPLDNCEIILADAFDGCVKLEAIDAPNCKVFGGTIPADLTQTPAEGKFYTALEDAPIKAAAPYYTNLSVIRVNPQCVSAANKPLTFLSTQTPNLERIEAKGIHFGQAGFANLSNLSYVCMSPDQPTILKNSFQNCGKIENINHSDSSLYLHEFIYDIDPDNGKIKSYEDSEFATILYEAQPLVSYVQEEEEQPEQGPPIVRYTIQQSGYNDNYIFRFKINDSITNNITAEELQDDYEIVLTEMSDNEYFNSEILANGPITIASYSDEKWIYHIQGISNPGNMLSERTNFPFLYLARFDKTLEYAAKEIGNYTSNTYTLLNVPKINENNELSLIYSEQYKGISNLNYEPNLIKDFYSNEGISAPNVYQIGDTAFQNCYNLQSVYLLGSHLTSTNNSIGKDAFQNCYNLKTLYCPNLNKFTTTTLPYTVDPAKLAIGIAPLKSVNFANLSTLSGTKISTACKNFTYLFGNNKSIEYVMLNYLSEFNDLTSSTEATYSNFKGGTFANCSKVGSYYFANTKIKQLNTLADQVKTWNYQASQKDQNEAFKQLNIGYNNETVTSLSFGDGAFQNCIELTSVNLSTTITTIPQFCFCECQNLTNLTGTDAITTIGDNAFDNCTLQNFSFSTIQTIGAYAFRHGLSDSIDTIILPSTLTHIGNYGLYNNHFLKIWLDFPLNNDGQYQFYTLGTNAFNPGTINGSKITSFVFPNKSCFGQFHDSFNQGNYRDWLPYFEINQDGTIALNEDNSHIGYYDSDPGKVILIKDYTPTS